MATTVKANVLLSQAQGNELRDALISMYDHKSQCVFVLHFNKHNDSYNGCMLKDINNISYLSYKLNEKKNIKIVMHLQQLQH